MMAECQAPLLRRETQITCKFIPHLLHCRILNLSQVLVQDRLLNQPRHLLNHQHQHQQLMGTSNSFKPSSQSLPEDQSPKRTPDIANKHSQFVP